MKKIQRIIQAKKYRLLSASFILLLLSSRISDAAIVTSGFYVGGGIQHVSAEYGLTRHFNGSPLTPSDVRNTDHSSQWQTPQLAIGYQHLFGRFYLGAEGTKSFYTDRLHGAHTQQIFQSTVVTYGSDVRYSNPFALDMLIGWAITPSAVIYARAGLSYTALRSDFNLTYLYMGKQYTQETDSLRGNRIGKDLGVGAIYQLSPHLMLQADYKMTFYGQMHYSDMQPSIANDAPSRKTVTLKTQTANVNLVYTFS